jgi:tyrosyl-tRNA synthetase
VTEHMKNPSERKAQHTLAREVVELVHGVAESKEAEAQHRGLFRSPSQSRLTSMEINPTDRSTPITASNAPAIHVTLPESLVLGRSIARVMYSAGLVASRSEGHRLAQNQGAYIGSKPGGRGGMGDGLEFTPIKLWDPQVTRDFLQDGKLLVLRSGKWKIKIVKVVSDEEFERLGLDAPGWKEDEKQGEANRTGKENDVYNKREKQPLVHRERLL